MVSPWGTTTLSCPKIAGDVKMTRPTKGPHGSWPLEMRAETAAAYCDEPSVEAFRDKVDRGVYSQPLRERGSLPKWHRLNLERDIALRHGLDVTLPSDDLAELI